MDSQQGARELSTPDRSGVLARRFGVPPFSILDTRQGYWQERKRCWRALISDSGESRENTLRPSVTANDPAFYRKKEAKERELGLTLTTKEFETEHYEPPNTYITSGVSLLDPVLCEIICQWFGTPNGQYFNCFAGDTVFGRVAHYLGNSFRGIELRPEQVAINNEHIKDLPDRERLQYICDDGRNVLRHFLRESQDLLFSCPPYYDLEVYSDLPQDASNQPTYADFIQLLDKAFTDACACLKPNRFAVIVVGDVRDGNGNYYGFPDDVKRIFRAAGLHLYNELILVEVSGNAAMRAAGHMKNRKTVKTHQNVLVFYKGDSREIKHHFAPVEPYDFPDASNEEEYPDDEF